jgi:hypothetical protein
MGNLLKITLLSTLLFLQGCMTYWANPGGRNWDTDLRTCTAQSTKNVCRTTNQVSNSVCRTFPNGETRCQEVTTPSRTICGPEENRRLRDACLQGIGWRKTDQQGSIASQQALGNSEDRDRASQLRAERNAQCSNPKYAIIIAKSPCSSNDYTAQHLSDPSKITAQQKPLMQEFYEEAKKRNPEWTVIIVRRIKDPRTAMQRLRYLESVVTPAVEQNTQRLLEGKITWGEFNTRGKQITQDARAWQPTP